MPVKPFIFLSQLSEFLHIFLESILPCLYFPYFPFEIKVADHHMLLISPDLILHIKIVHLRTRLDFIVVRHFEDIGHKATIGNLMVE